MVAALHTTCKVPFNSLFIIIYSGRITNSLYKNGELLAQTDITDIPKAAYFGKDGRSLASQEIYEKHVELIQQRGQSELVLMIELFIETQAAPKQDLQSAFKKCLDAVGGRNKSSGSQWEDWMHDVFQDIHP